MAGPPGHAQAQMQAQMEAQRRAQLEAQMEAQRRAQMNVRMDPRFQHNYQVPQMNPNASIQEQMRYQEMMAARAREAQRRQYQMVKREQEQKITHILYFDSREPVCENSQKMCQGSPRVHMIDVMRVPENSVPECVTHLPAIIDVKGSKCYRGSKCEQYIKRMMTPKKPTDQKFINFVSQTSEFAMPMTNFNKEDMTKQIPILENEIGGIEGVYEKWPTFSSDPAKAKRQSDMFLKRLKQRIDQGNIKLDPPIDDKVSNKQEEARARAITQAEIAKREREANMPIRNRGNVVFEQALP